MGILKRLGSRKAGKCCSLDNKEKLTFAESQKWIFSFLKMISNAKLASMGEICHTALEEGEALL